MSDIGLLNALKLRMTNLSQRQTVIAQNIANNDTPGYRAKTVADPDFSAYLGRTPGGEIRKPVVAVTDRMQALGAQPRGARVLPASSYEEKPNGNNVNLEEQMLDMGKVQADYQEATGVYRKSISLLKIAIGR